MVENREMQLNDYWAILVRRRRVWLIPALVAVLAGFGASYLFPPRYTSQSLVLIEEQTVPEGYVKPVVTQDILERITTMQQQVLSRNRLQPIIERLGLVKHGKSLDDVITDIRTNFSIQPIIPGQSTSTTSSSSSSSSAATPSKKNPSQTSNMYEIPGFTLSYIAPNAEDAKRICGELTSLLLAQNIDSREQVAQSTAEFMSRQVEEAKRDLDEQDSKLAAFKKQYLGQLPGDTDANLKILMGLNSQLEANAQTLNRAQQDKTYAEALLAQGIASWKATQSADNPVTLEQELAKLQGQLVALQARYTDEYPDVSKTKRDIAELQKRLAAINATPVTPGDVNEKISGAEPPELRQLRAQIHQYANVMVQATREQKRLQDQINLYQGRIALSPSVEEQFKALTRGYETAQKSYDDLLAKREQALIQTDMERHQQGEQMRLLNAAGLPDSPSFPLRWLFALGGLGAGLGAGLAIVVLLEVQDKAIRDEKDVLAALELPMLVSVPWVGATAKSSENGGLLSALRGQKAIEV